MIHRRLFLHGLVTLSLPAPLYGQISPLKCDPFRAGLILEPGPDGRCDDYRIGGPVVRWDGERRLWRMWYYGRSNRFPADLAPAFGSGSIATAVSEDGFEWSRVDGPLPGGALLMPNDSPGAFDSGHVATDDVIHHGDGWLMAYFGGNKATPSSAHSMFQSKGYLMRVGIARSDDGLNWHRVPGTATGGAVLDIPAGDVHTAFPGLLHDGVRLLLYYTTVDKQARYWRQRVAVSADGYNWTAKGDLSWDTEPPLFEGGGIITRDIMRNPFANDPPWLMVYTAKDGREETGARRSIGLAVSEDALKWRRMFRRPVFEVGKQGSWDHGGVAVPRLIVTGHDVRLYYYGWSDSTYLDHPARGIGCAVAPLEAPWRFRRL